MYEARYVQITIIHKTVAGSEQYDTEGGIPGGTRDYSSRANNYNRFTITKSIPTSINDEVIVDGQKKGSSRKVVGFWHIAFHHPARLRREKHGGEGDCSSCHAAKLRIQRGTSHNFP